MMTTEMLLTVAILVGAIVLFVMDRLRVDVVAMLVIIALTASGILPVQDAISGFSSTTVITLASLFIVGWAVFHTGLADRLSVLILRLAGTSETRLLLVLMSSVAVLSAFISSTGVVALMMPAVISLSKRLKIAPSRLLMPLSFSALMGGASTLIGTPPNIIVTEALIAANLEPFTFFSFTPMALILLVCGIAFVVTTGKRLIPDRMNENAADAVATPAELFQLYGLPETLLRARVPATSPLVGIRLMDSSLRRDTKVTVLRITRAGQNGGSRQINHPEPSTVINPNDVVILQGSKQDLATACERYHLEGLDHAPVQEDDLISHEIGIAEVILRPRSTLLNRTLADVQFNSRYHLTVLQLQRPGVEEPLEIKTTPLKFGDLLLVQGMWSDIFALKRRFRRDFIVLGQSEAAEAGAFTQTSRIPVLLVILALMVGVIIVNNSLLTLVSLMAALATVLTGCITMDDAYEAIDWKTLFLIAGMLPLSIALERVGLVAVIAENINTVLGGFGPTIVMIGLFSITAIVTQFLSNTVTAVLLAPIALGVAANLGVNPAAFLMAIAIASSAAYVTPVASPVNTLVMSAGNYRFGDYARLGIPLLLISLVITALVVPPLFPF